MKTLVVWSLCVVSPAVQEAPAQEAGAQRPDRPVALKAWPDRVSIDHGGEREGFVALVERADGITRDVTGEVAASWSPEGIARLDEGRAIVGVADGEAVLTLTHGDLRAEVAVTVAGTSPRPVSFTNDVMPLLTRSGCNAGACHGSASGKNGFHLSLFGYDPGGDHVALTRELRGRRTNVAEPEASLMLTKPTTTVPHKGGRRIETGEDAYRVLRDWIAAGVPDDSERVPRPVAVEILPRQVVLGGPERTQRFVVRARYDDGSDRDVTDLALLSSSNEPSAALGEGATVTSGRKGEAAIMARFGSCAAVASVLVLADDAPFTWPDAPAANYVDDLIHHKLERTRTVPAPVCSDSVFVRRVYLDLINRPPTASETEAFLADDSEDKRTALVDELLDHEGFAEAMALEWAEVLQVRERAHGEKGVTVYREYLRRAFRSGRPFDETVRALITAEGSSHRNAAVNFHLVDRNAKQTAEMVAQNFLGVRLQCAQCHDHPFENWTMDDYYGFAAFFARTRYKRGEDYDEWIVWDRSGGEMRHGSTGEVVPPTWLGDGRAEIPDGGTRRESLAQWLTDPGNRLFARNLANRLWARVFGRGIVDPPDDVRISNPPSHPRLLEALADKVVEYGFDVRRLLRDLCTSYTYQRAAHEDAVDPALFAANQVRRLSAEQLLDAIDQVTGVRTRFRGLPAGASATRVEGNRSDNRFLEVFGRPARQSACTCERSDAPTLRQALHLINGPTIAEKLSAKDGRLRRGLAAEREPAAMLDELYLAAYARRPREDEREQLLAVVTATGDARAAWEDIYWAILNSKEFLFQH